MPRSFGVFAPVGYLVIAFPGEAEAAGARDALLTGGYDEDEVMTFSGRQVVADIERTRGHASRLAHLGPELAHQERHLEYARQGSTFLVVYSPTEAEAARVAKVARSFHAQLAHRYRRFVVEDMPLG